MTKRHYPVHYIFDDEGKKTKKTTYIPKGHKLMLNVTYNKWELPKKYRKFPIVDFVQVYSADDEDGDRWSPIVDFSSSMDKNKRKKENKGHKCKEDKVAQRRRAKLRKKN